MNPNLINIVIEYCYYGKELMNELISYCNLKCDFISHNRDVIKKCCLEAKYNCKHCNSKFCETHKKYIYFPHFVVVADYFVCFVINSGWKTFAFRLHRWRKNI